MKKLDVLKKMGKIKDELKAVRSEIRESKVKELLECVDDAFNVAIIGLIGTSKTLMKETKTSPAMVKKWTKTEEIKEEIKKKSKRMLIENLVLIGKVEIEEE